MVKDFGPLLEGAIRWHDDRSLLIAQRHDLEEQIGALQAPRAQRSSRMPPSSRAVFSRGRASQGAARSGWTDTSADTAAHAGGRKGRLNCLYSRCWAAFKDMKTGDRIRETIDQQIRLQEKVLVVLSLASITSPWVEDEVETALQEERESPERRTVLVPIKIDNAVEDTSQAWAQKIKRTRHIGDFTQWDNADVYQKALARLLCDLTATARQPEPSA